MKYFHLKIFLLLISLLVFGCETQQKPKQKNTPQPNIVLILADDLGWSDLGCYGSEITTPNLDALAFGGRRYTQFYNTSKCFPSRAALLTGNYAQQVGAHTSYKSNWLTKKTIGSELGKAGYNTFWSGKHHGPDHPVEDLGFDDYYGLWSGASNHFNPGLQRPGEPIPAQKRIRKWIINGEVKEPYTPEDPNFYTTDAFTDAALGWLEKTQDDDQPFFVYLSYTAPHDPLMAWSDDIAKYADTYESGYEEIQKKRFEKQKQLGLFNPNLEISTPTYTPWEELADEEKKTEAKKMAVYAAMIDRLDQNIGRIIDQLKKSGAYENTLILFLSDNGASAEVVDIEGTGEIGTVGEWTSLGENWANVSNTPYRYYKNFSYEGGIKTPAIVHWPNKIPAGSIETNQSGHFIDILPSLLQLQSKTVETDNRVPFAGTNELFSQEVLSDRDLFWEWQDGRAVKRGNWKLVAEGDGPWDLYDLSTDPFETKNLSSENESLVTELDNAFTSWKNSVTPEPN